MFKKAYFWIALISLAVFLSSCAVSPTGTTAFVNSTGAPAATETPAGAIAAQTEDANQQVVIKDPALEKAVRFAISKPSGELTKADVDSIKELRFYGSMSGTIQSLDGIGQLTNLELLDIESAGLTDITPLAGLKHLTSLTLKDNSISDIAPVEGLTNLQSLDLSNNLVENIGPLSGLVNLTDLRLDFNKINDLSALKDMVLLTHLSLSTNMITDINVLASLKGLQYLDIGGNYKIKDFTALSGLENIENISVDFLKKADIDILKPYKNLSSVTFFGYKISVDPKAAGAQIDLSKYYDMMDSADALLSSVIKPGMTDYEKEFAIFGYVQDHVAYGSVSDSARTFYSAYGGLIRNRCECQGFSYTLCLLMNKAGVDCISVNGGGHYWNIVKLDDGYYHMDASSCVTSGVDYKYFNMNDTVAQSVEHWDKSLYPACDGAKYVYKQS